MNKQYRAIVVITLVMILLMNPALLAWGNPPPGRWEKVAETKPGAKINVYTKDGPKQRVRFQSINDQFITLTDRDKNQIQIELVAVDKIILNTSIKYAKNGALVGAGVGGGIGAYWLTTVPNDDLNTGGYVILGLFIAGLGAGVGYLSGAALGAPGETIYISKDLAMKEAAK